MVIIIILLTIIAMSTVGLFFISRKKFGFHGDILISVNEQGVKMYSLELYVDPEELDSMDHVVFQVKRDQ